MTYRFGPDYPNQTYLQHGYAEHSVNLGEILMNYAVAGPDDAPALLLVPAQTESWWGYEPAMKLLEKNFRIYAVDLRGQGRSTRTPGRYTLDNMGNDLVRFMQLVIKRPCIVAGLSSGGVLTCWLAAYALPGSVRAVFIEDAPLFHSEVEPASGHGIHNGGNSAFFGLCSKYLGDQWSIGDWNGMVAEAPSVLPAWMIKLGMIPRGDEPPQNLKEYDPEWARAFLTGTATIGCAHETMLKNVKVPVFFTHHFRGIDEITGDLQGAISDEQVKRAKKLVEGSGQPFDVMSFPEMGHFMHRLDPELYVKTLQGWIETLA